MQQDGRGSCTTRATIAKDLESSSNATKVLAHSLCAHCDTRSPESLASLESAVRSYAAEFREGKESPETLIIELKRLFERMDGHTPSLVTLQSSRALAACQSGCCALYQSTLAQIIDAYFAEPVREPAG